MSDVVVILGMHRSGTSAVAGVLTKLGAAAPKNQMPASPENTKGYFESPKLAAFHDELLASAGSYWADWRRFNPEWLRSSVAEAFRQRAKDLFKAEFDDAPLAVFKDPRVCRFAPFWLEVLAEMGKAPHIVIPVRSPLDVALSLKKSRGLSLTHGSLLWLRHVLDAEEQTRDQPRAIFEWNQFIFDWRSVSNQIAAETGLHWPRLSDRSAHEIEGFLAADLVHSETDHAELISHSDVHEWTLRVYDALLDLAANPLSNSAHDTLDQVRDLFERSSQLFGRALLDYEMELELAKSEKVAAQLVAEQKQRATEGDLAHLRGALAEVERKLSEEEASAEDLRARLAITDEKKRVSVEAANEELQAAWRQLVSAGRDLETMRASVDAAKSEFRRAEERAAQLLSELDAARNEKAAAQLAAEEELRAAQRDLVGFRAAVAELERKLRDEEAMSGELRARLAMTDEEKRVAVDAARGELQTTQRQLASTVRDLAATREASDEMKSEIRRAEERAAQLSNELDAARSGKVAAQIAAEEGRRAAQRDLAGLRAAAAEVERKLSEKEASAEALRARLTIADEEKRVAAVAANEELQAAWRRLVSAGRDLETMREELDGMKSARRDAEERIAGFSNELEAAHERLRVAENASADELRVARQELAIVRGDVEREIEAKLELEDQVETLEAKLDGMSGLLDAHAKTEQAHRKTFAQIDKRARALAIRQAIERELRAAARTVRTQVPPLSFGMVFRGAQLRSPFLPLVAVRRHLRAERKEIENWGFFDAQFYLAQNPDVAEAGVDPFTHFLTHGILEDRDPHPLFSSGWYRVMTGNELGALPPLLHYLRHGRGSSRSPHPLFDARSYLKNNKDVAAAGSDPLTHFLRYGAAERRDPHPLIWMERLANQTGLEGTANPLLAYLTDQRLFGASPHPLFDGEAYIADNKDVARSGTHPLLHYCAVGWREGRAPHRLFAGDWYLANNADVMASGLDPLHHYLRHGAAELRSPHPLFDSAYYFARYRDVRRLPYDPLSHYVMSGAAEGRETTNKITLELIREVVPAAELERTDPLSAFLKYGEIAISVPHDLAVGEADRSTSAWPPAPDPAYWLPQQLRDHIVERYGDAPIGLYLYLMSVVERYGDAGEEFAQSADFAILTERLASVTAQRRLPRNGLDVSIVIPVYNNLVFTLTSVLSVLENKTRYSYEILIGDDLSSDATPKTFGAAGGGLRLVRHAKNLGFLGNCNLCAELAKGRFIVLLNNDTLTLPGWLDELIDPIENSQDVGLAGSKLINADGTLQEAGGIFWRDGSAWNYGRNDNPRLPQYNYRKDVDYMSGASIALPTDLWRRLGGFDAEFAPAYCEDSDLAFRVRKAGLRTIYAPHSELVHHEGKSHGVDTGGGVKAYQVVNQNKLLARWKHVLEAEHFANGENVFVARDRSRAKPHILFVDHYIPQWDRDAGSRTIYLYMKLYLDAGFQVAFWPDNLNEDRVYAPPFQKLGVEVIYSDEYKDGFDRWFSANAKWIDYVFLSRPQVSIKYIDTIGRFSEVKKLYYGHDLHYVRLQKEYAITGDAEAFKDADRLKALELGVCARSDVILYPSFEECSALREVLPNKTILEFPVTFFTQTEIEDSAAILQNADNVDPFSMMFIGGFSHRPNVDGILWFLEQVFPLLQRIDERFRIRIAGSNAPAALEDYESDKVTLLGRISDEELRTLYRGSGIAIIPLRYGGGVKGKIIEAFALGTPVVSTSIGVQGIKDAERCAFVADDAAGFADRLALAASDRPQARARARCALEFIQEYYSKDAVMRLLAPHCPELLNAKMQ